MANEQSGMTRNSKQCPVEFKIKAVKPVAEKGPNMAEV